MVSQEAASPLFVTSSSYIDTMMYSALDEEDGPVILEVDAGRQNSYVAILIFLLNIYKVSRRGVNSPAAQQMPTSEARSILKAICKGRYSAHTGSDDSALEDYLDKFLFE